MYLIDEYFICVIYLIASHKGFTETEDDDWNNVVYPFERKD